MIPKIIHYCWFGGKPLPPLAEKCIASWRKYMPDYEIRRWDESNFDVNIIPYTAEAYAARKYAFVSDYARFWILYKYGGIYFDTDVEVIRPMNDIIKRGPFMGMETDPVLLQGSNHSGMVAPGLGLGVNPGFGLIKRLLECYKGRHFILEENMRNQITIVHITTDLLLKEGLKPIKGIQQVDGVYIYPSEYFCPINITTDHLNITPNTKTIHHYAGTWVDHKDSWKKRFKKLLPESLVMILINIKRRLLK